MQRVPRTSYPFGAELLTFCVTIAVYARSFWSGFTLDDPVLIVQNPTVHSWSYFPSYFTSHFWQNVQLQSGYYRPLVLLWFRIDYAFFGAHPAGWHVTSVLVHAIASVLVLRLVRRLTSNEVVSLIAGLLFALHPVHVEAASWISDVQDAWLTVWFVAGLLCFLRVREGSRWMIASVACYCGAMLTKEPGIVLPAVACLYVFLFESRERMRRLLSIVVGYVPAAVAYIVIRHYALHGFTQHNQQIEASSLALSMPTVMWAYVRMLLAPIGLSPFYDMPLITTATWSHAVLPIAGLLGVIIVLAILLHYSDEDRRVLWFAIGWYVITLAPALKLSVFSPGEIVHDRYIYLASVGFCLTVSYVLGRISAGGMSFGISVPALVVLIYCSIVTFNQQAFWENDLLLFGRSVRVAPRNDTAVAGLARLVAIQRNYPLAISLYEGVLKRNPQNVLANTNLGWIYFLQGDYAQAEQYLTVAATTSVDKPEAFLDLSSVYLKTHRPELAVAALRHAEKLLPRSPLVHARMSEILEAQGDLASAVREMEMAQHLAPADPSLQERLTQLRNALVANPSKN